ncbi:MAG: TerB N-terminal domain-containing protein, partial [Planctomycetota bacterium]|nr:TerB N-terminal domain-containing protein [Planctomycetota bacterium]
MPISLFDVLLRLAQLAILATMLGAAAASGVAPGRKRIVFVGVAVVAYALLVALWRAWRNLIAFPCDEFGPTAEDPERLREHFDKVAKANRNLVARWRVQGRLRDQLSRAREATEVERAEAAMEKAQAELEMWRGKYRVPGRERRALERRFRDEWEALRTLKYVHAAQAQMEHAHGLKTERGRDRARGRAQDVLSKGLNDSGADQELLLRFGRESGLLREDASEPAPQLTLAEVEARWVSDQETVEVGGRSLRGPLWLGAHLPGKVEEPSLIDPELPVSSRASGRTALAGSLSYAQLSGAQRAAFLDWIAQGRASEAPSTFLRLELCAVERRLVEGEASSTELRRDVPGLLALLERRVREGEERPLVEWARSLSRYASLRFPFEV